MPTERDGSAGMAHAGIPKTGVRSGSDTPRHTASFENLSFKAANGWRGPGALAIAVAHCALLTDYINYGAVEPVALMVDLFFVLSGFVIAQAYSTKLGTASAILEYIIRRFGRIWPLQAATLAVLLAYEILKLLLVSVAGFHAASIPFGSEGPNLWEAIPTNLLLMQALGIHGRETWNFPSWSLSVEFATYVSFAFLCQVGPVARRVLAIALIVASLAILMLIAPRQMRSTFDYGLFRCLAGFFAGTLCHDVVTRWRIPKWPLPTVVEIVTIVLVGVWLSHAVDTVAVFAAPLVFAVFLYVFVAGRGALSRVLATHVSQVFAEWSFAIYMVHAVLLLFFVAALHELQRITGHVIFVTIANPASAKLGLPPTVEVIHIGSPIVACLLMVGFCGIVLVTASFANRLVENPGRAYFGRLAKRSTTWRLPAAREAKPVETSP